VSSDQGHSPATTRNGRPALPPAPFYATPQHARPVRALARAQATGGRERGGFAGALPAHRHAPGCWGAATSGIPPREPLFNGSICRFAGAWGEAAFTLALRPGGEAEERVPLEARACARGRVAAPCTDPTCDAGAPRLFAWLPASRKARAHCAARCAL